MQKCEDHFFEVHKKENLVVPTFFTRKIPALSFNGDIVNCANSWFLRDKETERRESLLVAYIYQIDLADKLLAIWSVSHSKFIYFILFLHLWTVFLIYELSFPFMDSLSLLTFFLLEKCSPRLWHTLSSRAPPCC